MKKKFDIGENGAFTFELHGHQYSYADCKVLSERMSFNFQVIDSVLRTFDGKFAHIMVMADGPEYSQNGITKGSYIVEQVNEETAKDLAAIDNAFS